MKKNLLGLCALCLCLTAFAGEGMKHGEGRYESKTMDNLPVFHAVEVLGNADVEIVQRNTPKVIVSGRSNITALAQVQVQDGVLLIEYASPIHAKGKHKLHVMVGAPHLNAITATQGSNVKVLGDLRGENLLLTARDKSEIDIHRLEVNKLTIHASNHAEIDVEKMQTNQLEVKAFQKADVELSGHTEKAWLENNGSGDIDAGDLYAREVNAMTFSSGDIQTNVQNHLHAVANGRGKIEYKGRPIKLVREGHVKNIKEMD